MRTFEGHTKAAHVARFSGDGSRLFTASDDARAICWDIAAEAQVCTFEGHTDFVRAGALSPASPHMFATGSYDHTVKLWDIKAPRCAMTLRHVSPVEDLVLLPGGGMLATASGSTLTVWDILSGRILQAVSAHSKTITALCADAGAAHLLSASLDRTVKAYELGTCKVVGAIKYEAPLVCLGLSPVGSHLAVGTSDGTICVRRKRVPKTQAGLGTDAARDPLSLTSFGQLGQVAAAGSASRSNPELPRCSSHSHSHSHSQRQHHSDWRAVSVPPGYPADLPHK